MYICIGSHEWKKYSILVVDHEIRQISSMKSAEFHEIRLCQIERRTNGPIFHPYSNYLDNTLW